MCGYSLQLRSSVVLHQKYLHTPQQSSQLPPPNHTPLSPFSPTLTTLLCLFLSTQHDLGGANVRYVFCLLRCLLHSKVGYHITSTLNVSQFLAWWLLILLQSIIYQGLEQIMGKCRPLKSNECWECWFRFDKSAQTTFCVSCWNTVCWVWMNAHQTCQLYALFHRIIWPPRYLKKFFAKCKVNI